jgi:hypothetical protein
MFFINTHILITYCGLVAGLCFTRTKQIFLRPNIINMILVNTHDYIPSVDVTVPFRSCVTSTHTISRFMYSLVSVVLTPLSRVCLFTLLYTNLCIHTCIYYMLQTKCFIQALYAILKCCVHKMRESFRHNLRFSTGFISCLRILHNLQIVYRIHLSIYLTIYPFIHPSNHPSACQPACLSLCLSIYLSMALQPCLKLWPFYRFL